MIRSDTVAMAAAIAAAPAVVLTMLVAFGAASVGPAVIGFSIILAASVVLATKSARDLDKLEAAIGHAAAEGLAAMPYTHACRTDARIAVMIRDVERLSRMTSARIVLADQLRRADAAIVERLPDPLIILGADKGVRRANAAAHSAFGGDMMAVLRHPVLRTAIDRAFAQGTSQRAELSLPVPVPREVHATVILIDPPLSGGGNGVVILSDRTRERAVERTRADFVANASHELRTPLASLIGFIDTLRGPAADDPPAQTRFLGIMAEQAARMNRLIDDLLNLSRIELTEHQAPSKAVDLSILIHRVTAEFEPAVANRKMCMVVNIEPQLPCVIGDTDQLAQVLQNLLDNAIKYGRDSGTLSVSASPSADGSRWASRLGVVISVGDDGYGIPHRHLPRLTERFYRVDKGRSRSVRGTGLGLAIVKHIINRHRGQIAIESEEGIGTTVLVWLPQAHAPRTHFEGGSGSKGDLSDPI